MLMLLISRVIFHVIIIRDQHVIIDAGSIVHVFIYLFTDFSFVLQNQKRGGVSVSNSDSLEIATARNNQVCNNL